MIYWNRSHKIKDPPQNCFENSKMKVVYVPNMLFKDFKTVPPKKSFGISSSFCHFDTWNESISFVRKQIRCKKLQEWD